MIDFSEKVYNAKIKFSFLGFDEDNLTIWYKIGFDYEYGTIITEKVCLNSPEQIKNILNVLELRSWEELPRKYARIKINGKRIVAIGNVIGNNWVILG